MTNWLRRLLRMRRPAQTAIVIPIEPRLKKVLLTLSLGAEDNKRIEAMRQKSKAATRAEVVSNALVLYEWYLDTPKAGERVAVIDSDGNVTEVKFVFTP